jgi:hypothetical protein
MKRAMIFTLVLCVILCGCATSTQPAAPASNIVPEKPSVMEEAPPFDLAAYKESVDQFRRDVMDNSLYVGNIVRYEADYMKELTNIRGSADAESTLESAREWFEKNAGATLSDVEAAHEKIKEEYASLIIAEIEGKEAEELDTYIRAIYEGYSDLYQYARTASPTNYLSFTNDSNKSISKILDANRDISLFCGDYG